MIWKTTGSVTTAWVPIVLAAVFSVSQVSNCWSVSAWGLSRWKFYKTSKVAHSFVLKNNVWENEQNSEANKINCSSFFKAIRLNKIKQPDVSTSGCLLFFKIILLWVLPIPLHFRIRTCHCFKNNKSLVTDSTLWSYLR